ncbi:AAA family ATPase [Solirubrobacter sp. CPCC 204708]|uniref:AAA family ATPase n=1 Tax=Solirubrobacter deserti TaxID=2282478 RepID=A0ABT4RIA2_9ACTN|nr:LuxR family transcriptional regulator [Solirubrobacter deserti]MBE2318896.1 AAA family ATPase [Solirubrobacter deserti]MDA0138277.1 AAA family ATPase [Solirubrobacter deserti]
MSDGLLAREDELAAVGRTIDGAMTGTGAVLVLEGPAGIGKTAVLEAARSRASGALVLSARASELDRGFGFGLVHQLLDRVAKPELMTGAAAHASVVLDPASSGAEDAGFAVLHGLYWLTANLAEQQPVVLLADDLHWADVPSLRFLEYLARRMDGLRVALIATTRPSEPGAAQELLDELRASAEVVRPRPLDREAAAALLDLPGSVLDAALEVTGGNPLLLSVLGREVGGQDVVSAERLAEIGARGVAPAIERRLRPLGADAVAAARAAAVLGERATVEDVATVAQLSSAADALDRLVAADVLDGRAFVHPLVRAAVLDTIPAGERAELHRAAALRLRERGLRAGAIAPHWHATEPAGDARAVADLCAAAKEAAAEGATDLAADHLARALEEPPEDRAGVALELAELEVRAQRPAGADRLRELLRGGLDGDAAARAHAALANHLVHTDPAAAVVELEQATEDATDPTLALRLEAALLEALLFVDPDGSRLRARFSAGEPSLAALAAAANDGALRGMPTDELVALAERALGGGELLATVGPASSTWNLVTHALRFAEDARGAQRALEAGDRAVREQGLLAATLFVEQSWGYWHRDFGSVALGAARSRSGLEAIRAQGLVTTVPALSAVLAENLVELDKLEEAAAEVDTDLGAAAGTFIEPFVLTIRGRVRLLLRRYDEAEADLRRVVAFGDARGWAAPNAAFGRLRLAEVLAATGRHEEALELMEHDAAAALAARRPGCLGMALRRRALAQEGDEAIATLREAVSALEPTALRRELGWALHDLGARLRIRGDRVEAREPLRQALDLAARTESALLARHTHNELEASGARLRRERLEGVEALTPAERRVAQLAAEGLTNRQIAETLWVTLKTVEVHLGRSYTKLGIGGRGQLASALGLEGDARAA